MITATPYSTTAIAPLTSEQLNALFTDGFIKIPALLDSHTVRAIGDEMDRVYARAIHALPADSKDLRTQVTLDEARVTGERASADQPWQVRHIPKCGGCSPLLGEIGGCDRFTALARQILDTDDYVQIINQLHYKHPGSGVAFPWHQDGHHRGMEKGNFHDVNGQGSYLQIVVAIDPSTEENGGLRFVRGLPSYENGILPHEGTNGIPDQYIDTANIVTPNLRPGDAALFGPYTIHGSLPNTSRQSRRVFINGFACGEAVG